MKELTVYQCELCKELHIARDEAIECESQGEEIPLVKVGQMVEYEQKVEGGFPPFYESWRVRDIENKGHYLVYILEEYYEEYEEWYESKTIWGNEGFKKKCKIMK